MVDVDATLITELCPGLGRRLVLWVVEPPVELEIVHPLERFGANVAGEDLVLGPVLELVSPQPELGQERLLANTETNRNKDDVNGA